MSTSLFTPMTLSNQLLHIIPNRTNSLIHLPLTHIISTTLHILNLIFALNYGNDL